MILSTYSVYSQNTCDHCKKKKHSRIEKSNNCDDCKTKECCCETKQVCDIVIDLNNRNEICLPTNLKRGDFYRVVLKNFNKNAYNVSVNSSNIDTLKPIDIPNFSSISIDNLIKLTGAFNYSSKVNSKLIDEVENISFNKNTFESEVNILSVNNKIIEDRMLIRIEAYKRLTEELLKIKYKIDVSKDEFFNYKNDKIYGSRLGNENDVEKIINDLKNYRREIDSLLNNFIEQYKEFEKIVNEITPTPTSTSEAGKNIDNFKKLHQETLSKANELRDSLSAEKIDALVTMIIHLTDDRCYYSFPIQFTKDQSELKIELTPKNDKIPFQKEVIGPYTFPMEFPTYWSVGSSFYAGFGLENDRYSVVSTTENDVTTHRVIKEDTDNMELGFSAIVRYGKKLELEGLKNVGFHFSFGPGISIEKNPRPRFLLGAGLSVGDKHNLTFDAGLIAGYIDQKSNIVDENAIFTVEPTNLTVTRLKTGGFFSIGYFFKLN
jgi:hypothetical protein